MLDQLKKINTLKDIYFCINYWLYCGQITKAEASRLVKNRIEEIVIEAEKNNTIDSVDEKVKAFYSGLAPLVNKHIIRPLYVLMNDFIANTQQEEILFRYVYPKDSAHPLWIYGNLPEYFLDHPLDGLATKVIPSFDNIDHEESALYFSATSIVNSCTIGGYLKQPMEVRFTSPRYDAKIKNKLTKLMETLNIRTSKITKLDTKNNITQWTFEIELNSDDLAYEKQSIKGDAEIKQRVESMANGKAYFAYLDNVLISEEGFKTQADIQDFIASLCPYIICLSTGKNPTHLYLGGTRHLLSFQNKKGETVPLSKFRFDIKKEKQDK